MDRFVSAFSVFRTLAACLLFCLAIALSGCGVSNTAQQPGSVPPMPASGPSDMGSSPTPPPPLTSH